MVDLPTVDRDTLHLLADTGGGGGMLLTDNYLAKHRLATEEMMEGGQHFKIVSFAAISDQPGFPTPAMMIAGESKVGFLPASDWPFAHVDGVLGHKWFAGRVWCMDYLNKTLKVNSQLRPAASDKHVTKLGFQSNAFGMRGSEFPRIEIIVDGDTLQMLFDTGATIIMSDSARAAMNSTEYSMATSFIIESVFVKWKKKHPEWRVIQNGDVQFALRGVLAGSIEVPQVTVAGHQVGPVWFTSRPDKNFLQFMSRLTDRTIVGAVGGTLFQYFRITVDYPHALAKFER